MTLAKIIVLYLENATVHKRTARNNALALLTVFRTARNVDRPEKIFLTDLDEALLVEYQSAVLKRYCTKASKDEAAQREAKERALRSSRSTIRQARSLFARRGEVDWLAYYKSKGVILPESLNGFLSAKPRGRNLKTDYSVPPDSIIESTFEQIELMRGDRDVYVAFWLCVGAGLRRSEAHRCQSSDLVMVDARPRIIGGIGKDGLRIDVPVQHRAYMSILPFVRTEGYLIDDRGDEWARRLSRWMRAVGWKTRLTLHELRAYSGSLIYRQSPIAAMRFLRHKSIAITERNYVRYALQSEPVEVL